jgi:DNA-directed RNA polymerase specialized sigma24 family protein
VVLLSAQSDVPGFGAALSELFRIYWYPLYGYVRRRGHSSEEAQDLTQGFFLHLLEHKTLARADQLKEPPTDEQAAAALQVSVGAVKTLIHRLRKQYAASVREEIGRMVSTPAEIDAEIHELCEALMVAEGWILP